MPFTDKQIKLFKAAAADKEFAEKVGINQTTAKKLLKESKVKKYEDGGKVTTPKKEKERIKDMAKEERMKKILTEDMETFGRNEEDAGGLALIKAGGNMLKENKKAGGKIGMGMTKNNYKKGGSVKKCKRDGIAKRGKTRCKGSK